MRLLCSIALLSFLASCSSPVLNPKRQMPSAQRVPTSIINLDTSTGCFSQLIPILREGSVFSDESIDPLALERRGLIDLMDYDEMRTNPRWQEVISREGMSERDEELGFMALSMIKKEQPHISDEALKDRFEVLKAFCASSL